MARCVIFERERVNEAEVMKKEMSANPQAFEAVRSYRVLTHFLIEFIYFTVIKVEWACDKQPYITIEHSNLE